MPALEARQPDGGSWISYTTTTTPVPWTPTSQWTSPTPTTFAQWQTPSTTYGWITSYTTETDCECNEWEYTTPLPTTTILPIETSTPSEVIVVDHHNHGLSPGIVGAIVIGAFFGTLLLFLLCICCFRIWRQNRYEGSDTSSASSHRRRRRTVIIDPYPRRPEANLTFVGGGNYPGTRVMVSKSTKTFVRPSPVKQMRTIRETRRTEKIIIDDDDD
jgi:hypothetical protein